MTGILITLGLIITYFIIVAIKEGEARENIEKERKVNFKKIANLQFENMVTQELIRQKNMQDVKNLLIQQLESDEAIHKVSFEDKL